MTIHHRENIAMAVSTGERMVQPRAVGDLVLSTKARGKTSAIDRFRTSGCLKALFPRRKEGVEAILINTSGGLTGGDRLSLACGAGPGSRLVLTTQAAERAYRSANGWATMDTVLDVSATGRLDWLPQELILFEGARLRRSLRANLSGNAQLLMVEPVIFGRVAMGERLHDAALHDRVEIWRDDTLLYLDAVRLEGDLVAQLARPAVAGGAGAVATILYVGEDAEMHLKTLRATLPETAGASLLRPDVLVSRVLAEDGFALRQTLLPTLDRLSGAGLPISWRL